MAENSSMNCDPPTDSKVEPAKDAEYGIRQLHCHCCSPRGSSLEASLHIFHIANVDTRKIYFDFAFKIGWFVVES
jgi:hypothetical protein